MKLYILSFFLSVVSQFSNENTLLLLGYNLLHFVFPIDDLFPGYLVISFLNILSDI